MAPGLCSVTLTQGTSNSVMTMSAIFSARVSFETLMTLPRLAKALKQIERDCERRRGPERFVSRTLDIDILLYGDLCTREDGFEIPRDEILHANYVLRPLVDIAEDYVHPGTGKTFGEHWMSFHDEDHMLIEVPMP